MAPRPVRTSRNVNTGRTTRALLEYTAEPKEGVSVGRYIAPNPDRGDLVDEHAKVKGFRIPVLWTNWCLGFGA